MVNGLIAVTCVTLRVLPLGSVKAEGWLLRQLEKQRDGLTGHAERLYDDIGKSDWLTGERKGGQYAWERGPYYAKGLVALALVLDDPTLKARAKRWVDAVLASQRPDGDFGPKRNNWWANMIALHFLRDWGEATGDGRIIPFLERYFDYQLKALPDAPLFSDAAWAKCRVGDELEVLLWLHDRQPEARLLELAALLKKQASDWTTYYHEGGSGDWQLGYRVHIVNFMQGLKYPALLSRLTGEERDRTAYAAAFDPANWAMRQCGRVDRMLNGTEPLSTRLTTEGTELCAIAERILSCRDVVAATGEIQAADDLEVVAFNSLPAALGDDGKGCRYYLLLNQPQCVDDANLGYHCNPRGDASTPSPDPGFGCCRSNFHFAWPKFVQSLWMEREGGLAAVAYAPSVVKTARATVRMTGSYPFGDGVRLEIVSADGTAWPLFVRLPKWTANGRLAVNGADVDGFIPGRFVRLDRTWRAGDVVTLELPSRVTYEKGNHDSVAVRRGPLVYCARVESVVSEIAKPNEKRGIREDRTGFPIREYRPVKPWNHVLCTSADAARFVLAESVPDDPFTHGAEPCWLTVSAGRTDFAGWGSMETGFTQRAVEPPSPVPAHCVRDICEVRLVPLGATQTRITYLPRRKQGQKKENDE